MPKPCRSTTRGSDENGTVCIITDSASQARDCDAKQFIRYIVTNGKRWKNGVSGEKRWAKRTAHQKIPRIGDERNDSDLQIACVGGNQCKGSVFSGGSIVEKDWRESP